ncbi:transcriptional regulatory protein OmpR [Candidatus Phycosocius bacilliformis]|uniref:Transcriptional regulatory protein OmpR n=1 Tax=Candidatus Phycosocius bacilliformis TaxID=1445552 RepID=A0A2P2EE46_9PROT|nr:response regulator [Candidatus Phycosocius bacilliformis]GBF59339.1 transcriptional regulatory protein OmpR [Candidatus Phycosocius bacilliformis]
MITPETPHILIVDDHREIRESLGAFLRRHGRRVTTADSVTAAREALKINRFDLIVLDIMMPGEDGLSFCKSLSPYQSPPVILISARGDDVDRIIGLEIGADDYVSKPFNPRELLARIDAVIRRAIQPPRGSVSGTLRKARFGDWTFSPTQFRLQQTGGEAFLLSSTEARLLQVLVQRPGIAFSRDQLLDLSSVHGLDISERAIDTQISRLRRKLGDDPKNPRFIQTIWGGGYVFAEAVTWTDEN